MIELFRRHGRLFFLPLCALLLLSGLLLPRWRVVGEEETIASWYGSVFHGRATASGKLYNMLELTAAHRLLPFGTRVRVVDLETEKAVIVTITDRGPFQTDAEGKALLPLQPHPTRNIDLSYRAAHRLGMLERGVAAVKLQYLEPAFP